MWPRCSTYFQRKSSDLLIRVKGAKRPPRVGLHFGSRSLLFMCWHPFEKRGWPSVKKSRDSTWKWMSFKCRVFSPQNSNRFWSWKTTQREVWGTRLKPSFSPVLSWGLSWPILCSLCKNIERTTSWPNRDKVTILETWKPHNKNRQFVLKRPVVYRPKNLYPKLMWEWSKRGASISRATGR